MLETIQTLMLKAKDLVLPRHSDLTRDDVRHAREYISAYWLKLTRYHPKDDESLIGVPYPYLVPSYEQDHEFDYDELFYWDSYFMVQGMFDEDHKKLIMGILEDLIFIFKRYKIIPNASRTFQTSRSQPPFLTSLIFDIYEHYNLDKKWLKEKISVAQEEYNSVWMGTRKPHARQVYQGLSRYYDFNYLHDIAETESGWDMTPRFGRKCLHYLPIDLNALLYRYEMDFAKAAFIFGKPDEAKKWEQKAKHRKKIVDKLMWSETKGLFYDYNYQKERRGTVSSLASYYTMWAGMASEKQARKMVKNLRKFEQKGGLSTTDQQLGALVPGAMPTQWAYPNGWAPLHFIVIEGLRRYGYEYEARKIAMKWLNTNLDWFNKNGVFLEKYNVVNIDKPPAKGLYPSQTGFGWTNAIFERLSKDYIDK